MASHLQKNKATLLPDTNGSTSQMFLENESIRRTYGIIIFVLLLLLFKNLGVRKVFGSAKMMTDRFDYKIKSPHMTKIFLDDKFIFVCHNKGMISFIYTKFLKFNELRGEDHEYRAYRKEIQILYQCKKAG